jgi:iron complex transport system substrate-binding protein
VRICSLLPSATEIVCALGATGDLVGVTHECDYPPEIARIPKITRSNIPARLSSREIDTAVSASLESVGSLYELSLELFESLRPDLILTQRLCDVCAVSSDRVEDAVRSLASPPRVLNLEPHSLDEILENIATVGEAIGRAGAAEELVGGLRRRIAAVRARTVDLAERPRTLCLEWVDPPYCGGHWMKELVDLAGGRDDLAHLHRPSYRLEWSRVREFAPEILVLTCCGYPLERCRAEAGPLAGFEGVHELPAARAGHVYATDGSAFFARPGPRIVEGLEILAHLIHPERFPAPPLPEAFCRLELI